MIEHPRSPFPRAVRGRVTEGAGLDGRIVRETMDGLELVPDVYARLAERLGTDETRLLERLRAMLEDGRLRSVGVVPNHYRLGYAANGMTVWDIEDGLVDAVGEEMGAFERVGHCCRRPRHLPVWPYNLFATVHGGSREEVEREVAAIARRLGTRARAHEVLFSTRILKQTGPRFGG